MSQAVVFDLDGTLADTATDIARSLNAVLARHRIPAVELAAVRLMIGRGPVVLVKRALRHLEIDADEVRVSGLATSFVEYYAETGHQRTTLFPGARECLTELARSGTAIGVCSNKPQGSCESLLGELGIADLVTAVRGSAPGVPTKPDPTTLHGVLGTMGATQAVYVGDSETDVTTARAAGIPVVLVSWGYSDQPASELGADAVIDAFTELQPVRSRFRPYRPPAVSRPRQ
jgi:phosphoglycolate phosphatase